jgi:hypothetical protein
MPSQRLFLIFLIASGALLAGCATPPPPDPAAELPHCYKTNKGRVIACTQAPAPSLNADADAKRFTPDPTALTVYVVRRNWGDGRHFIKVQADGGPTVETLPNTMVRYKLKPGTHTIAFEFEGQRPRARPWRATRRRRAIRPDRRHGLDLEEHVRVGDRV